MYNKANIIHPNNLESLYNNPPFNHSVSITGNPPPGYPNRDRFVEAIEALGWEFHKNPKPNTEIVIGNKRSGSSKMVKARQMGLPILSPDEFLIHYPQFIVQ